MLACLFDCVSSEPARKALRISFSSTYSFSYTDESDVGRWQFLNRNPKSLKKLLGIRASVYHLDSLGIRLSPKKGLKLSRFATNSSGSIKCIQIPLSPTIHPAGHTFPLPYRQLPVSPTFSGMESNFGRYSAKCPQEQIFLLPSMSDDSNPDVIKEGRLYLQLTKEP
jgi:hypothetical protein